MIARESTPARTGSSGPRTKRVELSVADAERLGLRIGDEVRVGQNGSSVLVKVDVKERVQDGTVFLIEGIKGGNANALLNGGPVTVDVEKVGG